MRYEIPDDGPLDSSWLQPMLSVADTLARSSRWADQFFDPRDFMIMGRLNRRGRPRLVLYKHIDTRRYLNLDDDAWPYRYYPPRSLTSGTGHYRRHRKAVDAIDNLELWLLPWFRDSLASHREGLSYNDRWLLYDRYVLPDLELEVDPFATSSRHDDLGVGHHADGPATGD